MANLNQRPWRSPYQLHRRWQKAKAVLFVLSLLIAVVVGLLLLVYIGIEISKP